MSEIVNSSLKTAVKDTAKVFLGMVASLLLWFVTKILIIRNTSKDELGIYSLVVAIGGIFSLLATLGLQEGIARYVSIFIGEGKKERAKAFYRDALNLGIVSSLCVGVLLYIFSGIVSRYIFYKPELELPLSIISFFIPFFVMTNVLTGVLRGSNIVGTKVYADTGQPFFFLIFLSIFFILHFSFISIIYAYVFSMATVFIFISIYGFKKTGLNPFYKKSYGGTKELLKFSIPLLTVSILGVVLNSTDTLMLGRYTKAEYVGIYNVSISLAKLLTMPLIAIEFVFMPLAGDMYAKKQNDELSRTYQVITKWIFSATLPIFFVLFFFPEMTISFLFGERFVDSSIPLRILALGFLFHTFLGISGILFIIMGMSRLLMHISFLGVVFNIFLTYIFVKLLEYGVIGASIATAISYSAVNITIAIFLYKKIKIHPITAGYIKSVICSMISGLFVYALAKILPLYLWMMPLYLIIFISLYGISLLVTRSLDTEDFSLLQAIFEKTGIATAWIQNLSKSATNGGNRKNH
jgi:O-antigen/teichoic acid export membrane protein